MRRLNSKILIPAIVITTLATTTIPTFAEETQEIQVTGDIQQAAIVTSFTDVKKGSWCYNNVKKLVAKGAILGFKDTKTGKDCLHQMQI